jgi:hypothetical protein
MPQKIANLLFRRSKMKTKMMVLTVALIFVAASACFAQDPAMGTWKLNTAQSKIANGTPRNTTVVYEAAGDQIKVTVDGLNPDGTAAHNEWTGKFDGVDYAVTGDPNSDMRSYKVANPNTLDMKIKKDGKVTVTGKIVVSADGKTRTVTTSGRTPQGRKFKSIAVYDKQ